jgi:hypothetical protein
MSVFSIVIDSVSLLKSLGIANNTEGRAGGDRDYEVDFSAHQHSIITEQHFMGLYVDKINRRMDSELANFVWIAGENHLSVWLPPLEHECEGYNISKPSHGLSKEINPNPRTWIIDHHDHRQYESHKSTQD